MMFAAMSGTAIGDTGGLGLVEMKMMKDAGYDDDFAAGITAASSILGPIIPPSSCMVVLGSIAEISVASVFYGGVFPEVILALSLMGMVAFRAHFTKRETLKETVSACGVFMLIVCQLSGVDLHNRGLPQAFSAALSTLASGNQMVLFLVCGLVFLIMGCFLNTSAGVLLMAPILMPMVSSLGINVIHFGIIMVIGLMIGIITLPFGICLFVVAEVGNVSVRRMTREACTYLPAMIITLILVIVFPQLVTWLPSVLLG